LFRRFTKNLLRDRGLPYPRPEKAEQGPNMKLRERKLIGFVHGAFRVGRIGAKRWRLPIIFVIGAR